MLGGPGLIQDMLDADGLASRLDPFILIYGHQRIPAAAKEQPVGVGQIVFRFEYLVDQGQCFFSPGELAGIDEVRKESKE